MEETIGTVKMDPGGHQAISGSAWIGRTCSTPPLLHHGDLEEGRPHKHIRGKHSIHTDRDMKTCKLGGEGTRDRDRQDQV